MAGDGSLDRRPWRKRHPVFSRALLYALGAGMVALLAVLYTERRDRDAADEFAALRQELDDLSLVLAVDPDGTQVLRLLDEKFADVDLPPLLAGRALRWRALAHRRGGRHEGAEAALAAAARLDLAPRERLALALEWAEARAEAGDVPGARRVLPPGEVPAGGPLGMLATHVRAHVALRAGEASVAAALLEAALARLSAPLPAGPADYVGGRPWTPPQVATVMTELLARARAEGGERGSLLWRRLERLAPDEVDAQIAALRGYVALARGGDARRAWRRARALDARAADAAVRADPALSAYLRLP